MKKQAKHKQDEKREIYCEVGERDHSIQAHIKI
jgi:hypothetical protein